MNRSIRKVSRRLLLAGAAVGMLAASFTLAEDASAADIKTVAPGILEVGIYNGSMPYSGEKDGTLTGLEGELVAKAAAGLGLKVHITQGSFATLLSQVQAGRVDILIGSIGWNKSRTASGRFTDPVFYSPAAAAVAKTVKLDNISDLAGKQIAVSAGGYWNPGLKELEGANARVYDNLSSMLNDVAAGRIDVVLYDPLPLADAKKKRPDMPFDVKYLPAATDAELKAHPGYSVFQPYMVSWYLPTDESALEEALNGQIKDMYASGFLAKTVEAWGGDAKTMLTPQPSFAKDRQGVDRPADWTAPAAK